MKKYITPKEYKSLNAAHAIDYFPVYKKYKTVIKERSLIEYCDGCCCEGHKCGTERYKERVPVGKPYKYKYSDYLAELGSLLKPMKPWSSCTDVKLN